MLIEEIRQIDVQKLGGIYHKYPVSKIVADMIFPGEVVIDTTYGRGRFYAVYRPKMLIGIDVKKWKWMVVPDRFYNCTVWQFYNMLKRGDVKIGNVDVVVTDPPKWHNRKHKRIEYNYIIGSPRLIIYYAYNVARLLNAKYLLVHYYKIPSDIIDNSKIVRAIKFYFASRYIYTSPKSYSYFILYDLQKQ